jgi:lipopolysaccharide/colanic/teichoic acid biosynthesis glycosyltransferase
MNVTTETLKGGVGPARQQGAGAFDFSPWTKLPLTVSAANAQRKRPPQHVGALERAAALIGVIMVSPLMLLIAAAIKLDSMSGPVIFRQERVGLDRRRAALGSAGANGGPERRRAPGYGKTFQLCKFRTMIPDAEKHTGPVWAAKHDPRVTRLGRVLRRSRLDEIPQLFNVVRGEMRLIGPRPERPHFVRELCQLVPQYTERLRVPPGITGLAQVEREYDSSVDDVKRKIMYDLFYVRHWSRMLDAKILIKTIDVALRGSGAR